MGVLNILLWCALGLIITYPDPSSAAKVQGWTVCLGKAIVNPNIKSANETCQTELKETLDLATSTPTPKQMKKVWKNSCFRICNLKKLGLVTENVGSSLALSKSGISAFVNATYPASLRPAITDGIISCASAMREPKKGDDPKKCNSDKPLLKCIDQVLKKNCKQGRKNNKSNNNNFHNDNNENNQNTNKNAGIISTTVRPMPGNVSAAPLHSVNISVI